jgi:HlyD family secretion protein
MLFETANLSFPIPGQVAELLVKEGDTVQAGQVLARLDTTTIESGVAAAEAALAVAQANLEKVMAGPHPSAIQEAEAKATAVAAIRPVGIAETAAQSANLAAAQAQLDYLLAQPLPEDVAIAQAEMKKAEADLETAKLHLSQATLKAPFDATITEVIIRAHEYAWTGQSVIQISDVSQLKIEVILSDVDLAEVNSSDRALVTFEALPGIQVQATIIQIRPNESDDKDTSTFIVTLSPENLPQGLRWGMSAEVCFPSK